MSTNNNEVNPVNQRVREIRKSLNYTQEEFGNRLGVTKVAISNIEHEKRNVTDQMVKSICREYEVNEDWLRSGIGEMFLSDTVAAIAGFETYLKSVGFFVDRNVTKFHYDTDEVEGKTIQFPVEDDFEYVLLKDNYSVTLTPDEFYDLRDHTKDYIEGWFYKKAADQNKGEK